MISKSPATLLTVTLICGLSVMFCACSESEAVEQNNAGKEVSKEEVIPPYSIGNYEFESENLAAKNFLNGDPIPQAQSQDEWVSAGNEGEPAWCYTDDKKEVLYNYYAVTDPRGLIEPERKIKESTVDDLKMCLKEGKCEFILNETTQERNYLGKHYDLGLVNWWVTSPGDSASVMCWAEDGKDVNLHPVSRNNGFYVRCLKKRQ